MNDRRKLWAAVWLMFAVCLLYRAVMGAGSVYVQTDPTGREIEALPVEYALGAAEYSPARSIGVWIAAGLTLCIFSYMYRDNPAYRFAEAVIVGVSAAYWMTVAFWSALVPNLLGKLWPHHIQAWAMPGLSPERDPYWWAYFVPLVLGVMLLWRLAPRGGWISRWPLAFIIGTTAGVRLVGYLDADFLSQITSTIQPLVVTADGGVDWGASLSHTVVAVGVLCALAYFLFSIEHKGPLKGIARVGAWVLMITFGAAFGYTVMGRIALLAIRFEFLFDDWLWLIDPLVRRTGVF